MANRLDTIMKQLPFLLLFGLLFFNVFETSARPIDHLLKCWNQQVKSLQKQYITLQYQEKANELEHNWDPWRETAYAFKGTVWSNAENFLKHDTLTTGKDRYFSKTQHSETNLLFQDYGEKELAPVTQTAFLNQPFKAARYIPTALLRHFYLQKIPAAKESNQEFAVYKATIYKTGVTLYIRKTDNLLHKITTLHHDDLYGDVTTTYLYQDYTKPGKALYPKTILIEKINGKVKDEIKVTAASLVNQPPQLLAAPASYAFEPEKETAPEIRTEKYSSHLHFIELKHTDDRVLVVEFNDFLVVEGAPLNSENGELIIKEAGRIVPGKPIRYFTFGHHHPHYLGGVRPFIHKGATVLSVKSNEAYVNYLANAPHTLKPDSLQLQPRKLQLKEVKDSLTISDGKYAMKIYFIGKKSEHTNDYLIYYFPEEKLLYEDDLVWISNKGELKKAGKRQAGLYQAIKDLNLNVKTIVQSWPVADYGVKTVIPFADLKRSVQLK